MTTTVGEGSGMSLAATIFASLEGGWTLTRAIDPDVGRMTGTATFQRRGDHLLSYREDGELVLTSGYTGLAHREYHYLLEDDRIRICFVVGGTTGGTLYTLPFSAEQPVTPVAPDSRVVAPGRPLEVSSDGHLCRADVYQARYSFDSADRFATRISVTGPEKDHLISTTYRRREPT